MTVLYGYPIDPENYEQICGYIWNRDRALALHAVPVKLGIEAVFGKASSVIFDAMAKDEANAKLLKSDYEASIREQEATSRWTTTN